MKDVERELPIIVAGRIHADLHVIRGRAGVADDLRGQECSFPKHNEPTFSEVYRETLRSPCRAGGT